VILTGWLSSSVSAGAAVSAGFGAAVSSAGASVGADGLQEDKIKMEINVTKTIISLFGIIFSSSSLVVYSMIYYTIGVLFGVPVCQPNICK
jgi:hypothetical protein